MLRYIYLLCLIISFELVFCYNYIDNHPNRRYGRRGVRQHNKEDAEIRHRKRLTNVLEERPLAQIDVASFIQGPDDFDTAKYFEYDVKRRQPQKCRQDPTRVSRRHQHSHEKEENLHSYQHKQLIDQNLVKSTKKKCVLSKMFPFFSRNRSDPEREKEAKHLFHLGTRSNMNLKQNCSNDSLAIPFEPNFKIEKKSKTYLKRKPTIHEGIEKRYAEALCPTCKLKLLKMKKKRKNGTDLIHNSRQYYARLGNLKTGLGAYKQLRGENAKKQCNASNGNRDLSRRKKRKVKDTLNS